MLVVTHFRDLCVYLTSTDSSFFFTFDYKSWKNKMLSLQGAEFLLFLWKPIRKTPTKTPGCLRASQYSAGSHPRKVQRLGSFLWKALFKKYFTTAVIGRMSFQYSFLWSLSKWWHHVHHCNRNTVINLLQYEQLSTWEAAAQLLLRAILLTEAILLKRAKGMLIWELQSSVSQAWG